MEAAMSGTNLTANGNVSSQAVEAVRAIDPSRIFGDAVLGSSSDKDTGHDPDPVASSCVLQPSGGDPIRLDGR
jgi:hypothetical protein